MRSERTFHGRIVLLLLLTAVVVITASDARAGGCKPDNRVCSTDRSCCSGNCAKQIVKKATNDFGLCCATGDVIYGGACCTPDTSCRPGTCGTVSNGCGGTLNCGTCVTTTTTTTTTITTTTTTITTTTSVTTTTACTGSQACYDGPAGTDGVGVCRAGTQTCAANGTFGPCTGQIVPTAEIPGNGIDEDCDGADEPGGGEIPPSTVTLDATVPVEVTEIEGFDGGPARPVTALTDRSGIPMHFVEDELIVVTDDVGAAAALAARWGGMLMKSFVPADDGLPIPAQHLIRVAPTFADVTQLITDLHTLEPEARNDLRVASAAGLRLLTAAAREAAAGATLGLNVVMTPQGFEDRTTTENMSLGLCAAASCSAVPPDSSAPGCACGIPVPGMPSESFDANAFAWSYMQAGGPQNIGVGEAWRALSLAGLLGNQVTLAVIDGGFSDLAVDNPADTAYLNTVNPLEPDVYPSNSVPCSGGGLCPWHGANVVSAAMGPADDAKGAAGPAGPIATALTIRRNADAFSTGLAYVAAFRSPARIVNMSFGQRVPATLSWSMEPLNVLTVTAHVGGQVLIASAGNENADVDSEDCLPPFDTPCWEDAWWSPCENDGVFCTGALDGNATTRAPYSNWGDEDVDLFGPGTVWVGGDPSDPEPRAVNGTSFAAPFVAGVAALVMAANPQLTSDEVEQILVQTASSGGDANVRRYVNAQAAVNQALGGSPVCTAPTIFTSTPDYSTAPCLENVFTVTHSQAFGPFRYQWKKVDPGTGALVDVPEGGRVSGSTTDRMTINPFWPADEGRYAVVVSNLCGSTTSAFVTVTLVDGRVDRAPSLIEARSHVGMAFDRGRGRTVLFGGLEPSLQPSNDTWERDENGAWQFVTDEGPAPRFNAFMAYDEARGVSVLFGGDSLTDQGLRVPLSDTWEWDGTTWTERPAVVTGSLTHDITYDAVRQRVVRYDLDYAFYEWDGTAWTPRGTLPDPVNGMPTRFIATNSAAAFDRTRNVYVVKTGNLTWELDGSGQWLLKDLPPFSPQGPVVFDRGGMVFDSTRGRTLLYSLIQPLQPSPFFFEGTLWEWTGSTWLRKPTALLPTVEHKAFMAYDSLRDRTLITGIFQTTAPVADAFEWRYFADDPTCSSGPPM